MLAPWKKSCDKPRQCIKTQRHHFVNKSPYSQSYVFSSSHVWMWVLDEKEGWVPKIDVFKLCCWRRLLRVPWTARRSNQSVSFDFLFPKGNQPWIVIVRIDAIAETPRLWPPDVKSWPTGKDPDAGKSWGREETEVTNDHIFGWHHQLNGHELSKLRDSEGQGSLLSCSPWGHRVRRNWAFLPRSMCLLISWLRSLSSVILEPKKIVCHCSHCFPIYLP